MAVLEVNTQACGEVMFLWSSSTNQQWKARDLELRKIIIILLIPPNSTLGTTETPWIRSVKDFSIYFANVISCKSLVTIDVICKTVEL